jgi:two-component system, chemotaxis family, sensor kinase Cph1
VSSTPAFGQADLSNCEREQIHLAGSVQPHGLLLVVREPSWRIVQASTSAATWLHKPLESLLLASLHELGGDLSHQLQALVAQRALHEPQALRCTVGHGDKALIFEGAVHRVTADALVIELEPLPTPNAPDTAQTHPALKPEAHRHQNLSPAELLQRLGVAVQNISESASVAALSDVAVQWVRELAGYDRVMVYEFDSDGHGKIVAEARDAKLDSLLGHRYPATDIPQRARQLYLRNRVRLLVDVHYKPSELVPRLLPGSQGAEELHGELDMSLCGLRSMSPLHLQYLRNMGVAATLVVSIVREGKLWGLIACHHNQPRCVGQSLRAGCELLAEVMATRIAAIENYAQAQVALQVQRLEQRLVEATSAEGDWRLALFRNPQALLQPLGASGAVLCHDGEMLSCGDVPSSPELRALVQWVHGQVPRGGADQPFSSASVGRDNLALAALTPLASGVLAIRLSANSHGAQTHTALPDCLLWLRKEQLQSVTWAGDPAKPMVNSNPLELSPRRSFAVWSEIVRATSLPWAATELALAAAFGRALRDIIVQVNAVRLLIAESQLIQVRSHVATSTEAVVVADTAQQAFYANDAFLHLAGRQRHECTDLRQMMALFNDHSAARLMMGHVQAEQRAWRGEMALRRPDGSTLPVAVRAEPVPARNGAALGFIFIFEDRTNAQQAALARHHLQAALNQAGREPKATTGNDLVAAILANASLAAMDISDGATAPHVAGLLQEVEVSTVRATALLKRIRGMGT